MSFGDKIRELREKHGLSQQELANSINRLCDTHLKRNTISNYERNKSFPDYSKLTAIVNILDTSSDNLLGLNSEDQEIGHNSSCQKKHSNKDLIEEPVGNGNKNPLAKGLSAIGRGFSPKFRKCKYVLANEHSNYSKNCENLCYLNDLPDLSMPYPGEHKIRAFQLPEIIAPSLFDGSLRLGDIIVGEQIHCTKVNSSILYYLVIWKNKGLKVFRYHELVQLLDLPELLEIWKPTVTINYQPSTPH